MKQTNFSLADVLTALTALMFGFVCFLSYNFITMGNTRQSIMWALLITLLLLATSLGAKLLKRTSGNFKSNFIWEVTLLILFTGFMVYFTITPFSHYFSVAEQKQDIQSKLSESVTQAENMFTAYENYTENRENQYLSKLRGVVAAKNTNSKEYTDFGFVNNSVSDDTQIQQKMVTLHSDFFPTNYSDSANFGVKDVATAWLSDAKIKTVGWKPLGIVSVANEVEKNSVEWLNSLVTLSRIREKGEIAADFAYDLPFNDVKKTFTTSESPKTLGIGLAVVAYLLMLLSYLVTKRSTKTSIGISKHAGVFDVEY